MKKIISLIGLLAMLAAFTGCHSVQLESGGAYNPSPTTLAPEQALYVSDAAYKLSYDAVDAVLLFERNNRAQLQAVSTKIKTALDGIRPTVVDIDHRWALARQVYKANPTPANLTVVQNILAEIQRLVPVAQSQLTITQ